MDTKNLILNSIKKAMAVIINKDGSIEFKDCIEKEYWTKEAYKLRNLEICKWKI